MKTLTVIIVILFVRINHSYGQTHGKISIPILKESKAIDSLMSVILDPATEPNRHNTLHSLQDSAIIISIVKKDSSLMFVIRTETQKNINAMFNYPEQGKISFGYFLYKRINVFVADFDGFGECFSNTSKFKSFKFIYKLKEPSFDLPDGPSPKGFREWDFGYKNGLFSKWIVKIPYEVLKYSE